MTMYSCVLLAATVVLGLIGHCSQISEAAFSEVTKLIGNQALGQSGMGYAVALSRDGSRAMIGGPYDSSETGAVWAFSRLEDGTWTQQGDKITVAPPDTGGIFFGFSIALNADGTVALIGAPDEDSFVGTARFFTLQEDGNWAQQGDTFQGSDRDGTSRIGFAVTMDPAATIAFVTGPTDGSDAGAVWVVPNFDPWAQSGFRVVPNDAVGTSKFGQSIAVSDDAKFLLIGGPADNSNQGAAWVFVHLDNGTYIQSQSKLVPSDASDSGQFGTSVSLSPDSNTAVIGAPADSSNFGGVWVYTRLENYTFVQQTMKLVPSDVVGTTFIFIGNAVALSSDGYTALIGGYGDNDGVGAVWAFCRYPNDSWIQSGLKIVGTSFVSASQQGFALSYSSDAARFITGGLNDDSTIGAAWIFNETSFTCPGAPTPAPTTLSPTTSTPTRSPNVFSTVQKVVGTGYSGQPSMGFSVAISRDGSTAMVGGSGSNAVWVFERLENGTWAQQGDMIPGPYTFGYSVALSSNGNTAVIGAFNDNSFAGSASFYTRLPNKTWVQQGNKFQASDRQGNARTGWTVAIDPNASVAFAGGAFDHAGIGAVWVVRNDGSGNWVQSGLKLTPSDYNGTSNLGKAIAVSDDTNTLLVGGPNNYALRGAVWVFVRLPNGTYVQSQPRLEPTDAQPNGLFGNAISLSSDGNTVLIGGHSNFGTFGGVWVYTRAANGTYVQQTMKFVPSDIIVGSSAVHIGGSVALSTDGYTALVGAYGDDSNIGGVWVFCRSENDSWVQRGNKLIGLDYISPAQQGFSLAYSSETATFISGGQNDHGGVGAAWIFDANTAACPGAQIASPTVFPTSTTPTSTSASTAAKGRQLIVTLVNVLMAMVLLAC